MRVTLEDEILEGHEDVQIKVIIKAREDNKRQVEKAVAELSNTVRNILKKEKSQKKLANY